MRHSKKPDYEDKRFFHKSITIMSVQRNNVAHEKHEELKKYKEIKQIEECHLSIKYLKRRTIITPATHRKQNRTLLQRVFLL